MSFLLSKILYLLDNIPSSAKLKEYLKGLQETYKNNKYIRIITICTSSIITMQLSRQIMVKSYWKLKGMPTHGYIGIPIIGSTLAIFDPNILQSTAKLYPDVYSCKFGSTSGVVFNDAYMARKMFSQPYTMDNIDAGLQDLMFTNVNGDEWSLRRRLISSKLMGVMNSQFVENASKEFLIQHLYPIFDGFSDDYSEIKGRDYFRQVGFNIVCMACFGKALTSMDNDPFWIEFNKLTQQFNKVQGKQFFFGDLWFGMNNNFWKNRLCPAIFGEHWSKILDKLTDVIENYCYTQDNNILNNNVELYSDFIKDLENTKEYKDCKKQNINKRKLYGDMMTMFFASIGTTDVSLTSCCFLLAKYQDIQSKVYQELTSNFKSHNEFTFNQQGLMKMPILRAFVHESLRVFSPALFVALRKLSINLSFTDTNDNKYCVPKKKVMFVNTHGIHHNTKHWKLPNNKDCDDNINMDDIHLEFWLDSDGKFTKKRNGKLFFPFGLGKRDCVGQQLAMRQIYVVLALLVMKYQFIPPKSNPDMKYKTGLTKDFLVTPHPSLFSVKKREYP